MKFKETNPFYLNKKWKMKRASILKRDEYQCRECSRFGKVTAATTVHHINPLESYPEYKFHDANLISLCNRCHESMHNRFTGQLTDKGLKWVKRVENKLKKNSL
jgi:5-methylcytosine-specific restriction enzyme A